MHFECASAEPRHSRSSVAQHPRVFAARLGGFEDLRDHRDVHRGVTSEAKQILRGAGSLLFMGRTCEVRAAGDRRAVRIGDRLAPILGELRKCSLERAHATTTVTRLLAFVGHGQLLFLRTTARKTNRVGFVTRLKR